MSDETEATETSAESTVREHDIDSPSDEEGVEEEIHADDGSDGEGHADDGSGGEAPFDDVAGPGTPVAAIRSVGSETVDSEADDADTADDAAEELPLHPVARAVLDDVQDYFATTPGEDLPFAPPTAEFVRDGWFDFAYLDEVEEVERYWVNEPYAYVSLVFDPARTEHRYLVVEPTLDLFEQYVRQDLVTLLRNSLMYVGLDEEGERETSFIEQVKSLIDDHAATVDEGTLLKVLYFLRRDFVDYGPIDPIMRDEAVEDISCDGVDVPVFVYHREYRDLESNIAFDKRRLTSFTVRLAQRAGKQISVSSPLVDASLPNGSRIQLTLGGDVSTRGSNFTIRKFADVPYTPVDMIRWNTFSAEQMAYFWLAIENNRSLIFAGGTGSGKTTSMNAVSFFIPPNSKVVSIEDTREIDLPHDNWIQSITRTSDSGEGRGEISMYELLQAALRQRPEYILVGEIRTEQRVALTFFQAMGTGHTCYTTMHADSVETVLSRLENDPLSVPTQMLQDLDVVSIQRQTFIGERRLRRNQTVTELLATQDDAAGISANEVFRWDPDSDVHQRLGHSRLLQEIAEDRGWSLREAREELANRETVLQYMVDEAVTDHGAVAATIQHFWKDPEAVIEAAVDGTLDETTFDGVAIDGQSPASVGADTLPLATGPVGDDLRAAILADADVTSDLVFDGGDDAGAARDDRDPDHQDRGESHD